MTRRSSLRGRGESDSSHPPGRPPSWLISMSAGAVVFSLLALLLIPLVTGRWKRVHREEIVARVVPAGDLVDDLTVTLSRNVTALRGYLLSDSESFRDQLDTAQEEKQRILQELQPYVEALGPEVRADLERLQEADARWSNAVNRFLAGELSREEMVGRLVPQQFLFLALLESAERLSWRLAAESDRRLDAIADVERLEGALVIVLVLLALMSAIVVIFLTRRLRSQALQLEERAGAEQRQRERAEEAARTREEVLAVVAHDLRTPLSVICGAASLLLEHELDPGSHREQLSALKRSADRMDRLVQDLLDVARIESGRLRLRTHPEDAGLLLEEIEQLFRGQARARAIHFEVSTDDGLPPVTVDRDRFLQLLTNLVENAFKFVPDGGRVVVSAETRDGAVAFRVADTGPGIGEEELDQIFRRFWQGRRAARGGAGLGLAIARGIVEAHGGRIEVESTVGEGTVFEVVIPRTVDGSGGPARSRQSSSSPDSAPNSANVTSVPQGARTMSSSAP